MEGTGRIHGLFVIESLSETRALFFSDGAARRIEFTIKLTRVDESRVDLIGTALSTLGDILR
ncbi:Phage P2 GpU [compost metagenome]